MHGFFSAATKFSSFLDEDLGSYNKHVTISGVIDHKNGVLG